MNLNCAGILGYVLGLLGAGMLAASIGTVYWEVKQSSSVGLFQQCDDSNCVDTGKWLSDQVNYDYLATLQSALYLNLIG